MPVFLCVSIRSAKKIVKPWYARTVADSSTKLCDIFSQFATGEFDQGNDIGDEYQTTVVKVNVGESKVKLDVSANPEEHIDNIVSCLGHYIEFVVNEKEPAPESTAAPVTNIFQMMMETQRSRKNLPAQFPEVKTNNKIKLKNDILKWLARNQLGWAADTCDAHGKAFVETLADVLWYIDGHHKTLSDRGCSVPAIFEEFSKYRQPERAKHRKRLSCNLDYHTLIELSQGLFHLSSCSYFKTPAWKSVFNSILRLSDNIRKYASYLDKHVSTSQSAQARKVCRTDVDNWEIYPALFFISATKRARYHDLHDALLHAKPYEAIFMNDFCPSDRRRRNEYVNEVEFPCKTVRYSYTGLHSHLHFIWKLDLDDNDTQRQQKNDDTKTALKADFPVFHTRTMRREFVNLFGKVTGVKNGILREAYRRLTLDQSAPDKMTEAEVDERVRQALDNEDPDLIWDLRLNSQGRPEEYQDFLQRCQAFIQGKVETAVDDRRHDAVDENGESVVHLAMAMSARDLHEQVSKDCPEGTAIPSVQWLRLQFWPTNNSKAAHKNTGRLKIKWMVAARQFRKNHIDSHYASAMFRYEKEFAVRFRHLTTFVCEDDKHTIKVGEPGFPVAAVERGKRVLVGLNQSLQVGDHDFTKFSLSPSVGLVVDVPETIEESFYHGQVHVGLKENAFEASSALRHATELNSALKSDGTSNPIECHYHDGGPDHNLRFSRTQLVQLAYFLDRNLDLLILVQTPPHHSWKNPAERVMSNLNLGLQGVGMMRKETTTKERELKGANNLKAIRDLAKKFPDLEEEVMDAIQPVKVLLNSVFGRLQLKQKNFKVFTSASNQELTQMADQLKKIDEEFDTTVLLDSSKPCKVSRKLKVFMDRHCRMGHYQFSVKKCTDDDCVCGRPRASPEEFAELHHLPFPEPGQRGHYKNFEDLYGKDAGAAENHVPSKLEKAAQRHSMPFPPSAQKANNAKTVVQCSECLKWRVCYTARVLKADKKAQLHSALELLSYSCGSRFQDIEDHDDVFNLVYVNDKLTCDMNIEVPYYSTFTDPLCYYCGNEHDVSEEDGHFPICEDCKENGKLAKAKVNRAFAPRPAPRHD